MNQKIYKAVVTGYPYFFAAHIDQKKQMINVINLFSSKEAAQAWVADQTGNITSTRVSVLNKSKIIRSSVWNGTFSITLSVQGGSSDSFQMVERSFEVLKQDSDPRQPGAKWFRANLSEEVMKYYTP